MRRDLTSSFVIAMCLEEPDRIPEEADVAVAVKKAKQLQTQADWADVCSRLGKAHTDLDTAVTAKHIEAKDIEEIAKALAGAATRARTLYPNARAVL